MIYTVTLNPAIDLVILTEKLLPNKVNRTNQFELQANGKGVNVSFILDKLGVKNTATGIGGGFTLKYIVEQLEKKNILTHFESVEAPTRINVFTRVLSKDVEYKEVNPGPYIDVRKQNDFSNYLENHLTEKDTLIISGSFSTGIKDNYLIKLSKIAAEKHTKLVIDSSNNVVLKTLEYHPFLLKPNNVELANYFNIDHSLRKDEIIQLADKLIDKGCENVLVSLGEDGAALITKGHVYFGNAPHIKVINSAGAGDTMLGTFIGKLSLGFSKEEALRSAIAAGSDTASKTGLTDFDDADLLKQVTVTEGMNNYVTV